MRCHSASVRSVRYRLGVTLGRDGLWSVKAYSVPNLQQWVPLSPRMVQGQCADRSPSQWDQGVMIRQGRNLRRNLCEADYRLPGSTRQGLPY